MINDKIIFLLPKDALRIHDNAIQRYGGSAGTRDLNLLESAMHQPQIVLFGEYVYQDIYEMAAAYAFHIIKNHPFVDGNKRTGMLVSTTFLELNNVFFKTTSAVIYALAIEIASSQKSKEEIAEFFRKNSVKVKS